MPTENTKLAEGHQLYDPINGIRVGALSGGVAGALAAMMAGAAYAWLVAAGGVLGAGIGYLVARREGLRKRSE